MPLAAAAPNMERESIAFALMTAVTVLGTVVLLAGVALFDETNMVFVSAGGAVMVTGILAMAGYLSMIDGPDHAETGH